MHQSENKKTDPKSESKRSDGVITSLAIEALLRRCKDVLDKYVDDSKHCGNFPLPRLFALQHKLIRAHTHTHTHTDLR